MALKFMLEPALDTSLMTCPACGEEKRIWVHAQKVRRLRCGLCKRAFVETQGSWELCCWTLNHPYYLPVGQGD